MRRIWTRYAFGIAALALVLASGSASAWECDFLTGGGFIIRDSGAKANFGVGGGCKHGSPTWGHLEYIDHGTGLNVHWTSITAYLEVDSSTDSRGKPFGARRICGTARTNLYGDVDWFVLARDTGEPDHTLGGSGPGGGNIQLHNPNPSTMGSFGGSCPAFDSIGPPPR